MVFVVHLFNTYEPRHEISNNVVCAINITSYQPPLDHSMSVMLLTENILEFLNLKGGCTCSSESALVKMPHFWRLHDASHIYFQNPQRQRFTFLD